MIEWNKVTWYSKLGAIILFVGVVPALAFYIGTQYQNTVDYSLITVPVSQEPNPVINISGIDYSSLSQAPVPDINNEYEGVSTTTPLLHDDGTVTYFKNYRFDFEPLSSSVGCESGAFEDLGVLGYTLMGGVPTAVTIVHTRTCGTGYFPFIVLYQAKGEYKHPTIVDIVGIGGDRISISSLKIWPNHISLTYSSHSEPKDITVNLEYVGGRLVKKSAFRV